MKNIFKAVILGIAVMSFSHTNGQADAKKPIIKGSEVTYTVNGVKYKSYIAYDASITGKRPAILILPEWWGVNAYVKRRADMLAELGYVAMAVDVFGDGKVATTPDEAQKLTKPFYSDPKMGKTRIDAAEKKIRELPETDARQIGAIGYCFGGAMVLNNARMGSDYKATVSFHGGLSGVEAAKDAVKGKILVCHGANDKFVGEDEVKKFRRNMDSVGVNYTFKIYENATHAFTNPDATANGKRFNLPIEYNEKADKQSWADMKQFLKGVFSAK